MLFDKSEPIGLDVLINRLQNKLYNGLSDLWSTDVEAYPRCYINYKDNKKNIEHFTDKDEYETVLYAENTKFFFTQEEDLTPVDTFGFVADVNLFFIIDLEEVRGNDDRDDYQCLNDIVETIKKQSWFTIERIDTDFKSIFRNTAFIDETDNLNPYYCLKIELKSYRFETNLKKCTNE